MSFLICLTFSILTGIGDFRMEGFYVKEGDLIREGEIGDAAGIKGRLRLSPSLKLHKKLEFDFQVDFLWEGGNVKREVSEIYGSRDYLLDFRKAWFKWMTPVGLFSAGRMPNEWGLGIFVNSGDGYDWRFGVKRYGDIVDRILFATKPLGKEEPLVVALSFDRIVEDETGINRDDVDEWLMVIMWDEERWKTGFLSAWRRHIATDTNIGAFDLWGKVEKGRLKVEGEFVGIFGKTGALPLLYDEGRRRIAQVGFAVEGMMRMGVFNLYLQSGFASGDERPAEGDITFFVFDPDYNVGLIMFEKALAYYTERSMRKILAVSNKQKGINLYSTKGGVTNSYFFFPQVGIFVRKNVEWRTGWLIARGVRDFVDPYYTSFMRGGTPAGFNGGEPSKDIGWEVDTGIFFNWMDGKVRASVETGYFSPGNVFSFPDGRLEGCFDIEGRVVVNF